jgi:indole-3-glycerol phosphate synthase
MSNILQSIVDAVGERLAQRPARPDLSVAATAAAEQRYRHDRRSLLDALRSPGARVIAECKKASPSAGLLRSDFDPIALARSYAEAGAAAISVVTEPDFFQGDPAWLRQVREAVSVPVLRKDFIVSPRQIEEAALLGADAVLLIQRILTPTHLAELVATARRLHIDVLLELFTDEDPQPAVASGVGIIGVNARDLATFDLRLDRVAELAAAIPADRVRVAESGIHSRADLQRLAAAGYDAFLVGTHLVKSAEPGQALGNLLGHT